MNSFGAYGNMNINQWHGPTSIGSHLPSMQSTPPQDMVSSRILQSLNQMHEVQVAINSRLTNLETTTSRLSSLEETLTAASNDPEQRRQDASASARARGRGRGRGHGRGRGRGRGRAAIARQIAARRSSHNLAPLDEEEEELDPTLIDLGKPRSALLLVSQEAATARSALQVRETTVSMVIVYLLLLLEGR